MKILGITTHIGIIMRQLNTLKVRTQREIRRNTPKMVVSTPREDVGYS